jgi:hypothetical protein
MRPSVFSGVRFMRKVAGFIDAGYFWVQVAHIVFGDRRPRDQLDVDYPKLREALFATLRHLYGTDQDLLRFYWYDGPTANGKAVWHTSIDDLDDCKLRLGSLNSQGTQKAVDGLLIADMIGLAQNRSISDAVIVSGDADLVPAVVAVQALGVRVHLWTLGSPSATSVALRQEVDTNGLIPVGRVMTFASASPTAPPPRPTAASALPGPLVTELATAIAEIGSAMSTAVNEPAASSASTVPAATPPSTVAAPTPASSAPVPYESIAATVIQALGASAGAALLADGRVDHAADGRLLFSAKRFLGRDLTGRERRDLREAFKRQLQAFPPPAAAST